MFIECHNLTFQYPETDSVVFRDLNCRISGPGFHALFGSSGVGSATLAVVGTIVAEFIAADEGIGRSIRIALYQSDLGKILVALFLIGIYTSLYLTLLEWIGFLIQNRWDVSENA